MDNQGARFKDIGRSVPGYRPVDERVRDYEPVECRYSDEQAVLQASRCLSCGTPFCHGYGCPLGNAIPELTRLARNERWREAVDLLHATNNFPEFTARVCPGLCEASCVLGQGFEPVAIRNIEMTVVEKAYELGLMTPRPPAVRRSEKVAVVGSGPAGLAVADTLNRMGFPVTVFDTAKRPGGILRYGIPDFKLEKRVLDRRLSLMEQEGVRFETNVTIGDDISYHYLSERFAAICLAGGSRTPRDLAIPGRELDGIHFAMDYLVQQNRKLAGEEIEPGAEISAAGKKVIVLGGGDTGSDCLGTAIRQGAAHVCQFEIMPKPPEARTEGMPWPSWPNILRESSSHKEGGERRWSVSTRRFLGQDGRVSRLECVEVEWVPGKGGRMEPRELPGTEFEVAADLVLLALGFVGPAKNRIIDELDIAKDRAGNIQVDGLHMTSIPGLFAAGDMARGQSLVVRAIADGRDAARGIRQYLDSKVGE
ncbi:MAG: glutamate synthase subunit beta [Deltaproteobacteria bacterium]|nr:glutamate synthase subunit beta [Deltaproteobacteria bacterium]